MEDWNKVEQDKWAPYDEIAKGAKESMTKKQAPTKEKKKDKKQEPLSTLAKAFQSRTAKPRR